MMQATLRRLAVALAGGLILLAAPIPALSSPPDNDNFADAGVISALPFTDSGDLNGTTTEAGEQGFCSFQPQTVWYAFTPSTTGVISVDLNGSSGGVVLTAYQYYGGGLGGLAYMSCIYSFQGSLTFTVQAGTTYYFQVGSYYNGSVLAQLNVREIPPPPNDAFADAKEALALPFNDAADLTAATTEPGEPVTNFSIVGSAWYVFTPSESGSFTANANFCCGYQILTVYTGDSVAGLTEVKFSPYGMVTFRGTAGTTYHIQVGRTGGFGGTSPMTFRLDKTPPPVAGMSFSPFDPSMFDNIQFGAYGSYDPVNVGIETFAWSFGDGSTDTGFSVLHRYAADGDYPARLTVTTFDGRSASATQTVHVKTHDVAIVKFTAPNAASAGQTRQISVAVNNSRYPETVQVQLMKSVPGVYGGFVTVGTLTQSVPAAGKNQSTPFAFSYTFTSDDAAVGKVTFQAVATLLGARDAQSADNTAISLPTKVGR
jgi:PKD domain